MFDIFWENILTKSKKYISAFRREKNLKENLCNKDVYFTLTNPALHITYVILGFNNLNKLKLRFFTEQNIFKSIFCDSVV